MNQIQSLSPDSSQKSVPAEEALEWTIEVGFTRMEMTWDGEDSS